MKYAIIIDSVAAIPSYFLEKRPFKVMPVSIEIDGVKMPDRFTDKELVQFYTDDKLKVKSEIQSAPPTKEQISKLISEEVAPEYDYAFCQTISRQVSPTFDNFQAAAQGISKSAREARNALGMEHSFHVNCINTGSTLSGSGLIAIYADMLLNKGVSYNEYINTVQKFTKVVHCYAVLPDVVYSRQRGLERGIKAMSFASAYIGKTVGVTPIIQITYDHETKPVLMKRGMEASIDQLFYYAAQRIKEGLFAPVINVNYAGDLADLEAIESFQRLKAVAHKKKVKVLTGVTGLAAAIMFGPGSLVLGIAPKNQTATV